MNNFRNQVVTALRFASLWATVVTLLAACGGGGSSGANDPGPSDPGTASQASVVDVVGMTQAAAMAAITDANLVVGTVTQEPSDSVPAGSVISQHPAAAARVAPGSAVALVVSMGPASVVVPNAVGLTHAAATAAITDANLVVGTVTQEPSDSVPAGTVISQNPAAAASAAPGSAVALVVSKGLAPPADCVESQAIEGGGRQRLSGVFSKITDGKLVVSDVTFATAADTKVYVDGASASRSGLRAGDAVTITGKIDLDTRTGCAKAVYADADITAAIDVMDTAHGSLTVLGQQIHISPNTVLGDDVQLSGESSLKTGDRIRVSGLYADGTITATRIDRAASEEGYFVAGVVTELNAQEQTFRVNEIAVQYGGALLVDFPTGEPRNGDTVRLTGTAFESGNAPSTGPTVIQPTRMEHIDYGTLLAIFPAAASVQFGTSVQFIASGAVTWSISRTDGGECSPTVCGVIDSTGKYTAPMDTNSVWGFLITATSVADPLDTATASVFASFLPDPMFGQHTLRGEVFSFETGVIGGASVNLWVQQARQGYSYWWAHGPLHSDDLGLFEAPKLPDSYVTIDVRKEGYVQPCAVTSDIRGDVSVRVELMLRSTFDVVTAPRPQLVVEPSFSGLVFETTPTGRRPVAGAVVWLMDGLENVYATTMSDRSGGYFVCNVGSLRQSAWLAVTKGGFKTRYVGPFSSSESKVIEIELLN